MIDIHSHIIPGIDDGSKSMEMTLDMLKNAEKEGTTDIIATPHYLLEYGEANINQVKEHVAKINEIIKTNKLNISVYSGQEVYFTENIIKDYMEGNIGTLNDSRYMLIEFSMRKFDENIFDIIYELQIRDIVPIIAHPERYREIIETPSLINKFISEGYLFQVNAGSLEGKFGNRVKKTSEILMENGIYSFIGSDAHNNTNRCTGLRNALNLLGKKQNVLGETFKNNSVKILLNESVEFSGEKIKEKKSIFSFLKR
ncbi:tyrosine-protein phosphatase [Clostridium sp. CTA-5]